MGFVYLNRMNHNVHSLRVFLLGLGLGFFDRQWVRFHKFFGNVRVEFLIVNHRSKIIRIVENGLVDEVVEVGW